MDKSSNNSYDIILKTNSIIISKCWADDSFHFKFKKDEQIDFINNLFFPKELFAIYHKDKKMYEFIFLPLVQKMDLSFEYYYQEKKYNLFYGSPSEEFKEIVQHLVMNDIIEINDRAYGLLKFHQFYSKPSIKLIPTNFFITGDFEEEPAAEDIVLFKHVNFLMTYYKRNTPTILIYDTSDKDVSQVKIPCRSKSESFPKVLKTRKFDITLLELMEAARTSSSSRLKYIFYFQVLEYCSYYYLENGLKRKVKNIVMSPDILNSDVYSQRVLELLSDYTKNKNDAQRMEKLINDYCEYSDIKDELKENGKYFCKDMCFDGGLTVNALFSSEDEIDNPPKDIFISIRKNIDNIRNVLVHVRESRENKHISPTQKNALLLRPYLYLVRRLAETIITKFE